MLRKPKKQPQSVAEKVNKLLAHPNDSDSDDGASDVDVATAARVVDFDEEYDLPDARSTDFRKRNVKLLSEQSDRYKGKISSRKELEQKSDDEDSEDDSDDEEELAYEESESDEDEDDAANLEAFNKKLKAVKSVKSAENEDDDSSMDDFEIDKQGPQNEDEDDDDEDNEDDSEEDDDDKDDDDDDEEDDNDSDSDEVDATEIMTKTNQQAEIQKGLCVQNQLHVWERLLELRMSTHKFNTKANQLPSPETLNTLSKDNEELQQVLQEAEERSSKLLQKLLELQGALAQQHSELRQSVKRKQPAETDGTTQPASKRFASILQSNFQNMRNYRNEVLLKWDDRTKLLTPGAGTKRKAQEEDYDIIKKINSALANRELLIEKSQTLKNHQTNPADQAEAGTSENSQRQSHFYDDSDFYHQQLRELIEYKASSSSNMSEITKQFVELQKLRQKMKKKVDTRASKGRKTRYVVHKKLVNFMAPNEASDWTDESRTELYKSLFV